MPFQAELSPQVMSLLHVQMIQKAVLTRFGHLVDLSNAFGSDDDKERQRLSRSLAAYAVLAESGADDQSCAAAVVDGPDDNGMDAILYDQPQNRLYIVQAKWLKDGSTIELGEFAKFLDGVQDLFSLDFSRCNDRIKKKQAEIELAMGNSALKVVLILAYPSSRQLSTHVESRRDQFLVELNDTSEIVEFRLVNQAILYQAIASQTDGKPVNLHVKLLQAGKVTEPYKAYYGQMACSDLVEWYRAHKARLFSSNIRKFLGTTSFVNADIKRTLISSPEDFWYLNNGITALCTKISKRPVGGASTEIMELDCENLSIVNGAQTVGSIMDASALSSDKVALAKVAVRLISLQDCPPEFGESVTVATNNQNRIEARDFASLDQHQARLYRELAALEYQYRYKRDAEQKTPGKGCDFEEAAVALACARSLELAVISKRNVSSLWLDTKQAPYTMLFNDKTTPHALLRCVEVMRETERRIELTCKGLKDKEKLVLIHGNRFLLYEAFTRLDTKKYGAPDFDFEAELARVSPLVEHIAASMLEAFTTDYDGSYPMSFFKNGKRCADLHAKLVGPAVAKPTTKVEDPAASWF